MSRSFNGSSGRVNAGTALALAPGQMTFAAWVRATSFPNGYNSVVSRELANTGWTILVKSNAKLAIYLRDSVATDIHYDGTGVNTLSTATWYHLAMTYTISGSMIGYVNGGVDGTVAATANPVSNNGGASFFIGDSNFSSRVWNGRIAEAALWNTPLSAKTIASLAAGANPYFAHPDGIVAYWPLMGVDSPEPDYSGSRFSGTVTTATWAAHPPVQPGFVRSNRGFQPMPV